MAADHPKSDPDTDRSGAPVTSAPPVTPGVPGTPDGPSLGDPACGDASLDGPSPDIPPPGEHPLGGLSFGPRSTRTPDCPRRTPPGSTWPSSPPAAASRWTRRPRSAPTSPPSANRPCWSSWWRSA
ncbi:hypothetical protein [Kitasatospora fiedleri]|uniref:hypothetical protein n=1 Tax=Kitasatospora fiedleri TaxID=2991545 RepID=UPI00249C96BA|nr:hypothetical protein [Kitasatospora fiedleri]